MHPDPEARPAASRAASEGPSRRELLVLAAASMLLARARAQDPAPRPPEHGEAAPGDTIALSDLPRRTLGRTGRELPILGLGCLRLGALADEDQALAVVHRALETGARYFDVGAGDHAGLSARRAGKALKQHAREELFVAARLRERDVDKALAELERTLELLGTDYVDCVQLQEIDSVADLTAVIAKGGLLDALEHAREVKKLRHVGITALGDPRLVVTALERRAFETALVPVNPLAIEPHVYLHELVPIARTKETGLVAAKLFGGGALVGEDRKVAPGDLVRFALAQDGVAVAIVGTSTLAHWDEARYAASQPLPDEAERKRIAEAVAGRTPR